MTFVRDQLPDWPAYADREGIALHGRGKWLSTTCHFHDDARPSMRVSVMSGGWICMSCGESGGDVLAHYMKRHGIEFVQAAHDLGAWLDDGKQVHSDCPRAFSARAGLEVLTFESLLAWTAAHNVANGVELTVADRARLTVAARRIQTVRGTFDARC